MMEMRRRQFLTGAAALAAYAQLQAGVMAQGLPGNIGIPFSPRPAVSPGLWLTGGNSDGQIGNSSMTDVSIPIQIGTATGGPGGWTSVEGGVSYTIGILNGQGFGWGLNSEGQLGIGNTAIKNSPTPMTVGGSGWQVLAPGDTHWVGVNAGHLLTCGSNSLGQLGTNNIIPHSTPVQQGTSTAWSAGAAGSNFSMAINAGQLFGAGGNGSGNQGGGSHTNSSQFVLRDANTDHFWVACGSDCTYVLRGTGPGNATLWAVGQDDVGQLGDGFSGAGRKLSTFVQIGSETDWQGVWGGVNFAIGMRGNMLFGWGINTFGQLGLGDIVPRSSPTQIGLSSAWTAGSATASTASGINNGAWYNWGNGTNGRLGDGMTGGTHRVSLPVQVGLGTNYALLMSGEAGGGTGAIAFPA